MYIKHSESPLCNTCITKMPKIRSKLFWKSLTSLITQPLGTYPQLGWWAASACKMIFYCTTSLNIVMFVFYQYVCDVGEPCGWGSFPPPAPASRKASLGLGVGARQPRHWAALLLRGPPRPQRDQQSPPSPHTAWDMDFIKRAPNYQDKNIDVLDDRVWYMGVPLSVMDPGDTGYDVCQVSSHNHSYKVIGRAWRYLICGAEPVPTLGGPSRHNTTLVLV